MFSYNYLQSLSKIKPILYWKSNPNSQSAALKCGWIIAIQFILVNLSPKLHYYKLRQEDFWLGKRKVRSCHPFTGSLYILELSNFFLLLVYKSLHDLAPAYLSDLYTSTLPQILIKDPPFDRTLLKFRGNHSWTGTTLWYRLQFYMRLASSWLNSNPILKLIYSLLLLVYNDCPWFLFLVSGVVLFSSVF